MSERSARRKHTHHWAMDVDREHLQAVRDHLGDYAAGGVRHLVLGSISVTDDGRGTDTRRDEHGRIVRKPVMATKDLRFFDDGTVLLPDGRPRRGMSVVAALSTADRHNSAVPP